MILSKHNIVTKLRGSAKSAIVNILSGSADILEPEKALEIESGNFTNVEEYIDKGYLVDEEKEHSLYTNAYLDFIDQRETGEIQIFFVPWYDCNFACSYCYQSGYENPRSIPSTELIDGFFDYIGKTFAGRKKYITLFGGEPLLPGEKYEASIASFLSKAKEKNLDVAIVTNGYSIPRYMKYLSDARIREVQVTLDGTAETHDKRRPLAGGGPTFDTIVRGIDMLIDAGINVNLRVVLDAENIGSLPALASFAIAKGWTSKSNFKTQIGRNYELHFCMKNPGALFDRLSMYERIDELARTNPVVKEFFSPAFSVVRHLHENGELPDPLFDSCPACKTEWAFDYTGSIYSCTATVGKTDERLGTFYPDIKTDDAAIRTWQRRDVTTIPECRDCSLALACGGGCGSVAKNKSGSIMAPDCRPVHELIALGIPYYFDEVKEKV
jgi:uncharacterized protein